MKMGKMMQGNYPDHWPPALLHLFLLQYVKMRPTATAIIDGERIWSYNDLVDKVLAFTQVLSENNLVAGDIALLQLDTSAQAIALLIACSSLGIIYVPLSPETPAARTEYLLETTNAHLHIQAKGQVKAINRPPNTLIGVLDKEQLEIKGNLPPRLSYRKSPVLESDLLYIIFTSGTTGHPKGIMMTHRAVLAFFKALVDYVPLKATDRVGTLAPFQFDINLTNIAHALGSGATFVVIPPILRYSPKRLVRYLNKYQVTVTNDVPSIWRNLLQVADAEIPKLESLRLILFGGESFPAFKIRQLQKHLPHIKMINIFGHSESIACSFTPVPNPLPEAMDNLSIGFAHPGAELILLDEEGKEINETNKVGEMYLRSAALFSGYWRNTEATNKTLVPNPLRPHTGEKIFRTGDMGYKGEKGELYFQGRRDLQVQIGGFRVEIEEVETCLMQHASIAQVAIIVNQNNQNPELIAYIRCHNPQNTPTDQELRLFCAQTLPHYMHPKVFCFEESLPTTINGKVNRKALQKIWEQNQS